MTAVTVFDLIAVLGLLVIVCVFLALAASITLFLHPEDEECSGCTPEERR